LHAAVAACDLGFQFLVHYGIDFHSLPILEMYGHLLPE
jgi:hypothetical protein